MELTLLGFITEQQKHLKIKYRNQIIGEYVADIVVDDKIIIELKCVETINKFHNAQILNYLKITGYKLGLIVNFPNNRKGFDFVRVPNLID